MEAMGAQEDRTRSCVVHHNCHDRKAGYSAKALRAIAKHCGVNIQGLTKRAQVCEALRAEALNEQGKVHFNMPGATQSVKEGGAAYQKFMKQIRDEEEERARVPLSNEELAAF